MIIPEISVFRQPPEAPPAAVHVAEAQRAVIGQPSARREYRRYAGNGGGVAFFLTRYLHRTILLAEIVKRKHALQEIAVKKQQLDKRIHAIGEDQTRGRQNMA